MEGRILGITQKESDQVLLLLGDFFPDEQLHWLLEAMNPKLPVIKF